MKNETFFHMWCEILTEKWIMCHAWKKVPWVTLLNYEKSDLLSLVSVCPVTMHHCNDISKQKSIMKKIVTFNSFLYGFFLHVQISVNGPEQGKNYTCLSVRKYEVSACPTKIFGQLFSDFFFAFSKTGIFEVLTSINALMLLTWVKSQNILVGNAMLRGIRRCASTYCIIRKLVTKPPCASNN